MAVYDEFRIGIGWNVALGSLTIVEDLPAQSGYRFLPPTIVPGYDDGEEKFPGDGSLYLEGYPFVPWFMGDFRYQLWSYFFLTLNVGLRRNKVTIYTPLYPSGSPVRRNAWMHLPKPTHSATDFNILPDYTIQMLMLTVPS